MALRRRELLALASPQKVSEDFAAGCARTIVFLPRLAATAKHRPIESGLHRPVLNLLEAAGRLLKVQQNRRVHPGYCIREGLLQFQLSQTGRSF